MSQLERPPTPPTREDEDEPPGLTSSEEEEEEEPEIQFLFERGPPADYSSSDLSDTEEVRQERKRLAETETEVSTAAAAADPEATAMPSDEETPELPAAARDGIHVQIYYLHEMRRGKRYRKHLEELRWRHMETRPRTPVFTEIRPAERRRVAQSREEYEEEQLIAMFARMPQHRQALDRELEFRSDEERAAGQRINRVANLLRDTQDTRTRMLAQQTTRLREFRNDMQAWTKELEDIDAMLTIAREDGYDERADQENKDAYLHALAMDEGRETPTFGPGATLPTIPRRRTETEMESRALRAVEERRVRNMLRSRPTAACPMYIDDGPQTVRLGDGPRRRRSATHGAGLETQRRRSPTPGTTPDQWTTTQAARSTPRTRGRASGARQCPEGAASNRPFVNETPMETGSQSGARATSGRGASGERQGTLPLPETSRATPCTFLARVRQGGQHDDEFVQLMTRMILLLTVIVSNARRVRSEMISNEVGFVIEPSFGAAQFKESGEMWPEVATSGIMFDCNANRVLEVLESFRLTRNEFHAKMDGFVGDQEVGQVINDVKSTLNFTATRTRRPPRSVGEWIASFLGLYNTLDLHEVKGRLEHVDEAIRLTFHQVEAVEKEVSENADNIDFLEAKLKSGLESLREKTFIDGLKGEWLRLKATSEAIVDTASAALDHRLSPQVRMMADLPSAFDKYRTKLERAHLLPAIASWQQLFQLRADVWGHQGHLRILVIVPATTKETLPMRLLRWQPRPMSINSTLFEFNSLHSHIAVDDQSGATIPLTDQEVARCTVIGQTSLCRGSMARYTPGAGPCISAVWRRSWTEVAKSCPTQVRPLRDECWATGSNDFMAVFKKTTTVIVRCQGAADRAVSVGPGMHSIHLSGGCSALTEFWSTLESGGNEDVEEVTIEQEMFDHFQPSWNESAMPEEWHLQRPRPVTSTWSQVDRLLQQSGFSHGEIIGISLAVGTLLLVLGLVAASYLLARFGPRHGLKVLETSVSSVPGQGAEFQEASGESL